MDKQVTGDIFDIKRFAIHDGPGIRTTVFFRGCPLVCWWCHNPEARVDCGSDTYRKRSVDLTLPSDDNVIGPAVSLQRLIEEIGRDRVFYEESGGGLTVSGGEPMMQPRFLGMLLNACRESGTGTVLDTSGYAPWPEYENILGLVDLFLVDIKLLDEELHIKYTGVSNRLIIENIDRFLSSGARVQARIPMIPGITDTDENISALISFLAERKGIELVSLLPYNRLGEDKFKRLGIEYVPGPLNTQSPGEMKAVAGRFHDAGLDVRIGG